MQLTERTDASAAVEPAVRPQEAPSNAALRRRLADGLRRVAGPPPASRWRFDLWVVLIAVVGSYLIASAFDLRESLTAFLARYERWQADELPLTGIVLALGLAWYALRRRRETQTELALREAAEAHASELLAHNRELARQLISAQEDERRALARELHDELGQRCSAILVETACLRHSAGDAAPSVRAASLRTEAAAQSLYQLVADMLRRLRPADLDALGLVGALQALCERWEERSGVACVFHHEGLSDDTADALDDSIAIAVYRITQESLTNVWRHAQARNVRVRLMRAVDRVTLAIHDDGRGMDPAADTHGLGLLGATERAAAIGGVLSIRSAPGTGTGIELVVPLAPTLPS
ncbi:MAG: sensor histidine kinase [Proteobacteria bacterium]|nr:sensor histidine kinase [Pseudomonadota bacterium]